MVGHFISFEGCEGSGKSTQIEMLSSYLRSIGESVVVTREPGGCINSERIRDLLLERDSSWDILSELYLLLAARKEHIESTIKVGLSEGSWILSDRYDLSTYAYQGYGGGLDLDLIESLSGVIVGDCVPELTILLDIDPAEGLRRALSRSDELTRYDALDLSYHERVRSGFLALMERENFASVRLVSGDRAEEQVFADVVLLVESLR